MLDIHEILVPVDFSDDSSVVLEQAALVAAKVGANLHVMHAWQAPEFVPSGERTGGRRR